MRGTIDLLTNYRGMTELLVIGQFRGKAATAYNEHIAKIAALPRGINILLFLRAGSR